MTKRYEQVWTKELSEGVAVHSQVGVSWSPFCSYTGKVRVTIERIIEEPELKPCPFCGCEASLSMGGLKDPLPYVKCNNCTACVEATVYMTAEKRWNTRPQ